MGKLNTDDTSKPAPKNKVSVLFILTLSIILATIGIMSWSFFGKHNQKAALITTARTTIDAPVQPKPQLPPEPQEDDIAPAATSSAPEPSSVNPEIPEAPKIGAISEPAQEADPEKEITTKSDVEIEQPAQSASAPTPPAFPEAETPLSREIAPPWGQEDLADDFNAASDPETFDQPQMEASGAIESPPQTEEVPESVDTSEDMLSTDDGLPPTTTAVEKPKEELATETAPDLEANDPPTDEVPDTKVEAPSQPEVLVPSKNPEIADPNTIPSDNPTDTQVGITEEVSPPSSASISPERPEKADDLAPELVTAIAESSKKPAKAAIKGTELPWQKYAGSFDYSDDRPRIAIVISEAGISAPRTRDAIEKLPAAVTLGFNPYGRNLQDLVDQAREAGHEVLLQLPMEPLGYPRIDPGPQAMRTDLTDDENQARLAWALTRFTGYAGVTNQMGSKFTSDPASIQSILTVLKEKGVLYLDSRTASDSVAADIAEKLDIPVAINNRFLDHKADGALIDARLEELESIAKRTGSAIGVAYPHSVTYQHLSEWAATLDQKGLVLAPVSALIRR